MEGMDGFELCVALRQHPDTSELPIVLVSAREDSDARERSVAVGASAFLTKRDCAGGRLLATIEEVARSQPRVA